jgi:hypothetical protein
MTYRVVYGDELTLLVGDQAQPERAQSEVFSTEFEALTRARELIDSAQAPSVAVCDTAGKVIGGVCLHLKLEHCTD